MNLFNSWSLNFSQDQCDIGWNENAWLPLRSAALCLHLLVSKTKLVTWSFSFMNLLSLHFNGCCMLNCIASFELVGFTWEHRKKNVGLPFSSAAMCSRIVYFWSNFSPTVIHSCLIGHFSMLDDTFTAGSKWKWEEGLGDPTSGEDVALQCHTATHKYHLSALLSS